MCLFPQKLSECHVSISEYVMWSSNADKARNNGLKMKIQHWQNVFRMKHPAVQHPMSPDVSFSWGAETDPMISSSL